MVWFFFTGVLIDPEGLCLVYGETFSKPSTHNKCELERCSGAWGVAAGEGFGVFLWVCYGLVAFGSVTCVQSLDGGVCHLSKLRFALSCETFMSFLYFWVVFSL